MRARDRLAIIAAGAAFCVASLAATAFRQSAVEARVRDLLARELAAPCAFDACTFSVLDGFELSGLTVLDPDDPLGPPLLRVGEARFDYNLGLIGGGPRLTSLELFQPELRLVRAMDGSFPLLRILAADQDDGATAAAVPPVRVVRGTLEFGDPSLFAEGHTLLLREINLRITPGDGAGDADGFSLEGNARSDLLGALGFSADLDAAGHRTELAVELGGAAFSPELADRFRGTPEYVMRDLAAKGTVRGNVRFVLEGRTLREVEGETTLDDVSFVLTLPEPDPDLPAPEPLRFSGVSGRVAARDGSIWLMGLAGQVGGATFAADGAIQVPLDGTASDVPQEMDLTVSVEDLALTEDFTRRLPSTVRRVRDAYSLVGTLDAEVSVSGPVVKPAVRADVEVTGATASYVGYPDPETGVRKGFPWPVTDVSGEVHVDGSRVTFTARGRHGDAEISAEGALDKPEVAELDTDVTIRGKDVPLDAGIRAALGDELAATAFDPWEPSGVAATVGVRVTRRRAVDGQRSSVEVHIGLDGRTSARPDRFPVDLTGLTGQVLVTEPIVDGRRTARVEIGIGAVGEGFTVEVDGQVDGSGVGAVEQLEIAADVSTLEGAFLGAVLRSPVVADGTKRALRTLDPRGSASLHLNRTVGGDDEKNRVGAQLRGVSVFGWNGIPLQLEDLEGDVVIDEDALAAGSIRGSLLGARVHGSLGIEGLSHPEPSLSVRVNASRLPLDSRLRRRLGRLADGAAAVWTNLQPGPDARADVTLAVEPDGAGGSRIDLTLDALRGRLDAGGLGLDIRNGNLAYDGAAVEFACDGTLAGGELRIARGAYDPATGRLDATLTARSLAVPGCFAGLIPPSTQQALENALPGRVLHVPQLGVRWEPSTRTLELHGEVGMRPLERGTGRLGLGAEGTFVLQTFSAHVPVEGPVTFEGAARATDVHLEPGVVIEDLAGDVAFRGRVGGGDPVLQAAVTNAAFRVLDLPFEEASLTLGVDAGRIKLEDVRALLHGGELTGRLYTGEELAFRGRVQVTGAQVSRITTAPSGEPNEGLIDLTVRFRNPTGGPGDLVGVGRAELREGRILRVPVLTRVTEAVNAATMGVAGATGYFREGYLDFELDGDLLVVRDLFLEGPEAPDPLPGRLELRSGQGVVSLEDQRIDLLVAPRFSFGLFSLDPTGIVSGVMNAAQWLVLRQLRVEGTLRNPRSVWQILPIGADDELRPRPQPAGDLRPLGRHPW